MTPSQSTSTEGRHRMMTAALIREPRASSAQMLRIMEILQLTYTPKVARKNTDALWKIERSDSSAAIRIASYLSLPRCSSSLKRVPMSIA